MSHSTNSGFKVRRDGEDGSPGVKVSGAGREEARRAWAFNSSSPFRPPLRLLLPPVTSATEGVDHWEVACIDRAVPPCAYFFVLVLTSSAQGVVHWATTSFSGLAFPRSMLVRSTPLWSRVAGVSQFAMSSCGASPSFMDTDDKEPLSFMRRANFRRAEESALNRAAQPVKVSPDTFPTAAGEHTGDVFDDDAPGPGLDEDTPGNGPQVALIG